MTKLLVADDDPVSLVFLKKLLEDRGFEVVTAPDGRAALALARQEKPDLVLTDLVMPYLNGMELIRELREDRELASVPVLMLSMKDREEDVVGGLEEADEYMVKPFHVLELVARIRKALQRAGRAPKP